MSVVSTKKIVSPHLEKLAPEAFCKVEKFEKCVCRVVAVGTNAEMTKKLEEVEMKEKLEKQQEEDIQPSPKKVTSDAGGRGQRGSLASSQEGDTQGTEANGNQR